MKKKNKNIYRANNTLTDKFNLLLMRADNFFFHLDSVTVNKLQDCFFVMFWNPTENKKKKKTKFIKAVSFLCILKV